MNLTWSGCDLCKLIVRAMFIVALALGIQPSIAGQRVAMSDVKSVFVHALGVLPGDVKDVHTLVLPVGHPFQAIGLSIIETRDGLQGFAIPLASCKGQSCAGSAIALPLAKHFLSAELIDLRQATKTDLRKRQSVMAKTVKLKGQGSQYTLLIRSNYQFDSGEIRDDIVILHLSNSLRVVWQEVTRSIQPNGGGFESHELTSVPSASGYWANLELLQTTVPGEHETPFMPGPPLLLRYQYQGQSYQQVK